MSFRCSGLTTVFVQRGSDVFVTANEQISPLVANTTPNSARLFEKWRQIRTITFPSHLPFHEKGFQNFGVHNRLSTFALLLFDIAVHGPIDVIR